MSFIPEEEIKHKAVLNLAPMIDFLFLLMMFFATLAITRMTTKDTDIELVEIKPETNATVTATNSDLKVIHISINEEGKFKWVSELQDYYLQTPEEIGVQLSKQHAAGLLPEDKTKTQVLLKIDKKAQWEPILKVLFAIRDQGFEVRPAYEPEQS